MQDMSDGGKHPNRILETVAAIALVMALLFVVTPLGRDRLRQSQAEECLAQRYQTERAEATFMMEKRVISTGFVDLVRAKLLPGEPACPGAGTYVWLRRQPQPLLGCSLHYAAGTAGEGEQTLFAANFDDQSGLGKLTGNWQTVNGVLNGAPGRENRIAFGDPVWTDYELRVTAVLVRGDGYGIYYRADGKANISGYCFQYHPGRGKRFLVRRVVGGSEQYPLQDVAMPPGFAVFYQSHHITVAITGDRHVIKVDDRTVFDFTDGAFPSGAGGFQTWGNTVAHFDDLNVRQR